MAVKMAVKMALFCAFMDRLYGLRLGPLIKTQKEELGQYPVILTSRLVNNAYVLGLQLHYKLFIT